MLSSRSLTNLLYCSIIKKEERADGSGIDLVPDVVTHSNEVDDKKGIFLLIKVSFSTSET